LFFPFAAVATGATLRLPLFFLHHQLEFLYHMKSIIYFIEGLNIWVGRAFGWCILILTMSVTYEVFVRYALNSPTVWAFDVMVQMYGALFLMAGPYALAQDGHVRADVLYRLFPVRVQATLDFILYLVFFFPGILALFWYGAEIAADSWRYKEVSWNSPARIQVYFFKTLIPLAGSLLIIQGIAELMRCWIAIRTGKWQERLKDVSETEDLLMKENPGLAEVSPTTLQK
jgi:TRAP-type mannitol/chloroaromatic compound transport system permease small subunit